ncbi:MAG: phosphate ABC transporter permease subunit PstC [Christensenellaceae bacterium]|nr:phosphate ABC transporter permease subunit PstC [Christensenellaceae bacterium]
MKSYKEQIWQTLFLIAACASIAAVALICIFLFTNGSKAIGEIGLWKFLTGTTWRPGNDIYGILPMIVGSILVTFGAIVVGVPVGVLAAVFMAKFCPKSIHRFLKPLISLLAGIPSVVFGFFGLSLLVPLMGDLTGSNGKNILTASILLGMMILPTIIEVSESSMRAVPESYYEGARALGATHERTTYTVMLPAARSGVMAGIVLGIGRAIGETLAVIWVAGNQPRMPKGLLKGIRTLTANIVLEMGYAADLHRDALIATGVVLFVFILIINLTFSAIKRRMQV